MADGHKLRTNLLMVAQAVETKSTLVGNLYQSAMQNHSGATSVEAPIAMSGKQMGRATVYAAPLHVYMCVCVCARVHV